MIIRTIPATESRWASLRGGYDNPDYDAMPEPGLNYETIIFYNDTGKLGTKMTKTLPMHEAHLGPIITELIIQPIIGRKAVKGQRI